jgi:CubicO group peptidase (beta-lactamase class C family)
MQARSRQLGRLRSLLLALVLVAAPAAAQETKTCGLPAQIGDGWSFAAPADVGIDGAALCGIDKIVADWPQADVHAAIVVRHGKLIAERYYTGPDEHFNSSLVTTVHFTPETKHDLRSISKSVTSLLLGIALGEDKFPSLDTPVLDVLTKYADLRTPEKERINFRHLLTMSAGLVWDESAKPYGDPANSWTHLRVAIDPIRYVLERPVAAVPGEVYAYNSGGTEVLAATLAKMTGRRLDNYAQEKLFGPLGITDFEWAELPVTGQPAASAGLRLRPRDTAKLGHLMLGAGVWEGRRVLPADWVAESMKPRINGFGLYQYGYQWWLGRSYVRGREVTWTAGMGDGGQRLYVVPTLDLVVVVNSGLYHGGPYGSLQEIIPLKILNLVLASAVNN